MKLPCVDCITLPICRSIIKDQYERLHKEIRDNNMWFITDTLRYIDKTMIHDTLMNRCSLAKDYLSQDSNTTIITIKQKYVSALFSYIHLRSYIFYRETQNRYNKIQRDKQIDIMKEKT